MSDLMQQRDEDTGTPGMYVTCVEIDRLKQFETDNENLRKALKEIIDQCPNPKLPYGISVVEIARKALE